MLYCPRCETNVLTAREEIDMCLAIILLIFTSGIGLIIYLVYYYSKDENRCVHCRSTCSPHQTGQEISLTSPTPNPYRYIQETQQVQQVQQVQTVNNEVGGVKFCNNCGSKINRPNTSFCPFCGTSL